MRYLLFLFPLFLYACSAVVDPPNENKPAQLRSFEAEKASTAPAIDGSANDPCWAKGTWYPMDQDWINKPWTADDFQGRYKLAWDENFIYILAEIHDDTIVDIHADGLDRYWDDDCLEIFIDEDRSKGNHQYNHNAFAYHIALDYKVADIGPDSLPHYYNDHIHCRRSQEGNKSTWEVAMKIYNDQYIDGKTDNPRVRLEQDKLMGFAIAYCDNDRSKEREHFIGSTIVMGEEKNLGWIDAGVFGPLRLKK